MVLERRGRELIRLDRQRIGLVPESVAAVRDELLATRPAEAGFRLGYVLGVRVGEASAATTALLEALRRD